MFNSFFSGQTITFSNGLKRDYHVKGVLKTGIGSLFMLAYSVLAIFSIGLFTLHGAVLFVIGAALKTIGER